MYGFQTLRTALSGFQQSDQAVVFGQGVEMFFMTVPLPSPLTI